MMIRFYVILIAFVLMGTVAKSQTQSDTSDSYWEVVMPRAASIDIDMRQVLVGEVKDSVVAGFVSNTGSWPFRVDSIYFQGADAGAFSLVSGFPQYEVGVAGSHHAEFRFAPTEPRNYQAEVVIVTQAATLTQSIFGEGVKPQLAILEDLIDFGKIYVGQTKDSLQVVTIKNIGTAPLEITDTKHNRPNVEDFRTIAGGGAFTLPAGDTCKMDLSFAPSMPGRTSGTLEFHYDGVGSPAVVQLYGEGLFVGTASAILQAPSLEAYPGHIIEVPIILNEQEYLTICGATSLKADLSFNPTLLWPMDFPKQDIDETTAKITLDDMPVNAEIGKPLSKIRFKVGLGNTEECELTLSNGEAVGGAADISLLSGNFRLLGVCRDGGARLISPNSTAGLLSIMPNPVEEELNISFSLTEKGYTEISMYNTMGERVKTLFSGTAPEFGHRSVTASVAELQSGNYLVILRTPTIIESYRVMVVR